MKFPRARPVGLLPDRRALWEMSRLASRRGQREG